MLQWGVFSDKTFSITNQFINSNLTGNISITGSGFNFTSSVGSYNPAARMVEYP
jgi:hypothetical protein